MSEMYPWERDWIYIAVDPAQWKSAIVFSGYNAAGTKEQGSFTTEGLMHAAPTIQAIKEAVAGLEHRKIILSIEYPKWNAGSAQSVRAAANAWIQAIKETFPRRVTIMKIDPNTWQSTFSFRDRPSGTTKEWSMKICPLYGHKPKTHDEADAWLIFEHARMQPIFKAPKKKVAKVMRKASKKPIT
jgi:hypothetical protein